MNVDPAPARSLAVLLKSIVRTGTPALVGIVIGWLATWGLNVDNEIITQAITWLSGVGYYGVARLAETLVNAKLGWLLGAPGQLSYDPTPGNVEILPPPIPRTPAAPVDDDFLDGH